MSNNFNMSFDAKTRQEFADILADYGLTVPQAFKLFANQVIKTGVVPLSFDWRNTQTTNTQTANTQVATSQDERVPSDKLLKAIAQLENGETTTYDSLDDFVKAFQ